MGRMTDDLEERLDKRMADLDSRTQTASDRLDNLSPLFDRIGTGLNGLEDLITGDLSLALQVHSACTQLLSEPSNFPRSDQQIQLMQAWIAHQTCKELLIS